MKEMRIKRDNVDAILKEAQKAIKEGRVIICPTDTVYGLCADALDQKAVSRVFKIKKRDRKKPLSVFVKSVREASKISFLRKEDATKMKMGKITGILMAKRKFPKGVLAEDGTIGIRIPNHDFVKKLLEKTKTPLTGTSANISGKPASTEIKEILAQFKKERFKPDLVINAGNLKKRNPSAVIDFTRKGRVVRK